MKVKSIQEFGLWAVVGVLLVAPVFADGVESAASGTEPTLNSVSQQARRLAEAGETDAAREILLAYLKEHPVPAGAPAVPDDLQYLFGGDIGWWRALKKDLIRTGIPLMEILAALLVLGIVLFRFSAPLRHKPRLSIEDFDVRGFDEDPPGGQFSKGVLNQMSALHRSVKQRVDLVAATVDAEAVPDDVTAVIPSPSDAWFSPVAWIKSLTVLFDWLLRPPGLRLEGELHQTPLRGIGATIRLLDGTRMVASDVIWFREFDARREPSSVGPENKLLQLAGYVAAWAVFQINERHGFNRDLGGTRSWRAHVFMRSATQADIEGRELAARILFQKSINCDPLYRAPRVNLGNRLRGVNPELAKDYLERARNESVADGDADFDKTFYAATYNLVVMEAVAAASPMNLELEDDPVDPKDGAPSKKAAFAARSLAKSLEDKAATAIRRTQSYAWRSPYLTGVAEYLERMRRSTLPIDASMEAIGDYQTGAARLDAIASARADSSLPLELINIACAYAVLANLARRSMRAGAAQGEADQQALEMERCLQRALDFIHACFQISDDFYKFTTNEMGVLKIVHWSKGEELKKIYTMFRLIEDDPDPVEEEVKPLAAFSIIGEQNADLLAAHDIVLPADLLMSAKTDRQRHALAKQLGVDVDIVLDWAQMADLGRIVGITPDDVNLLRHAGIDSLESLKKQSLGLLRKRLRSYAASLGVDAPDDAVVEHWRESARKNTLPTLE